MIKKEFKQFFRDPGMPRMVMMFPILIVLVFPFAANMEVKNIKLSVVDSDRSAESSLLIDKCSESGYFKIVDYVSSPAEAQALMDRGKVDAILTIENGFSSYLGESADEDPLPLGIKVNTVNGTRGSIGSKYLTACVSAFVASHKSGGINPAGSSSYTIKERYAYNQYLDYKLFMIPALIVVAITMLCGFLPAMNIVSEKEKGTIEQINVSPVRKTTFIVCKMVPYIAVAFFMVFTCLLLSRLFFGYRVQGSLLSIIVFTLAHILVMASFGLLVSNFSQNTQQAMFVVWFFSMIFMLMSGIFTPIEYMPRWAEIITYANPLRYFASAMRSIVLKGASLADNWVNLCCLLGIGTLTTFAAVKSYKKTA